MYAKFNDSEHLRYQLVWDCARTENTYAEWFETYEFAVACFKRFYSNAADYPNVYIEATPFSAKGEILGWGKQYVLRGEVTT
jgi:hypothetical protein